MSNSEKNPYCAGPSSDKIWTPSNVITLFRICLVPVFVVALISPWPEWFQIPYIINDEVKAWISAAIFIVISCTDWVDGYLARRRNEITDFGKFLDPLADKILVAAALIALVELGDLPSWPALIILTREFIVSGIRMLAASKGYVIAASWYGKAKTVLQIIAIVLFIIKGQTNTSITSHESFYVLSWLFMAAALVMTVLSMLDYISKARPLLFSDDARSADVSNEIFQLATQVIEAAAEKNLSIGTAESLTGGMISSALTAVPGSSSVFKGACVTYVNEIKSKLLSVNAKLLEQFGAVNEDVASQMALGAKDVLNVDVSVSVTGVAGPGGGTKETPVGTVFMGISYLNECKVSKFAFSGDRKEVREKTTIAALEALLETLN